MSLTHQWLLVNEHRSDLCLRSWDREFSWAECADAVRRSAGALRDAGVGSGDVVALQLPKSPEMWFLHLALLGMGAVTMPLNPDYTAGEVGWMLKDAGAILAIGTEEVPGLRVLSDSQWSDLLEQASPHALEECPPLCSLGVICYTSGTTGRPKGARILQSNIAACVDSLHEAWRWSSRDVLIHALPLFHVHGLFVAQHGALRAGATVHWLERFDAQELLRVIEAAGGTVVMGVPTFYVRLLAQGFDQHNLDSVRLFTSGSAPLPAATWQAFHTATGRPIIERYGMTEVGIVVSNPLDAPVAGTIGFPLPGVRARVVLEGEVAHPCQIGELQISGASVFDGYHNRPKATSEALDGDWMRTGDLGFMDEQGRITLVGRRSEMVISGGLNVYPAEVEAALVEHPLVRDAAVFGIPDSDLGEQVQAAITVDGDTDGARIRGWLRSHLASFKIPKRVHIVEALPRNAMGKVTKQVLKARFS